MYASQQICFKDRRIISAFHFPEEQTMNVTQKTFSRWLYIAFYDTLTQEQRKVFDKHFQAHHVHHSPEKMQTLKR